MNELAQNVATWTGLTLLLGAAIHIGIVLAIPTWLASVCGRWLNEIRSFTARSRRPIITPLSC